MPPERSSDGGFKLHFRNEKKSIMKGVDYTRLWKETRIYSTEIN